MAMWSLIDLKIEVTDEKVKRSLCLLVATYQNSLLCNVHSPQTFLYILIEFLQQIIGN